MHNDNPFDPPATEALIVHGRDIERTIVHSWSRDGRMQSSWPGDGKNIPPDGTRIGVKLINFPIGSVREIWLDTGARTHPHGSYEDVIFYQISGRRVQMCQSDSGTVDPGDVSFEPHGVEHSTYQLIGGLFVEFALPAPRRSDGRGLWMKGTDAYEVSVAVWEDNGVLRSAEGAEAWWAPTTARRHVRRIFAFPGHELIETRLPTDCDTVARTDIHDTLFYIVEGRVTARIGDITVSAEAGDSLRAPAGVSYLFSTGAQAALVIQAAARSI